MTLCRRTGVGTSTTRGLKNSARRLLSVRTTFVLAADVDMMMRRADSSALRCAITMLPPVMGASASRRLADIYFSLASGASATTIFTLRIESLKHLAC